MSVQIVRGEGNENDGSFLFEFVPELSKNECAILDFDVEGPKCAQPIQKGALQTARVRSLANPPGSLSLFGFR